MRIGDVVRVNKDIYRLESKNERYAILGEIGIIIEIFTSWSGKFRKKHLNAKVKCNDSIKTFKVGSLDLVYKPNKG